MCEPVMKSEDVFFFVVMMNMEMQLKNSGSDTFILQNFVFDVIYEALG